MTDIEQKIIEATIGCIERYGLENVTNQRIGEMASVNAAAVSYYFRGKDNLIRLAQETALKSGFEWADYAHTEPLSPREQLSAIFVQLAEGAKRYPNLTKSFFASAFLRGDYGGLGIQKLNEFLRTVFDQLRPKCPNTSSESLKAIICRAFSAGVLPMLIMPHLLDGFLADNADDEKDLTSRIPALVDLLWEEPSNETA